VGVKDTTSSLSCKTLDQLYLDSCPLLSRWFFCMIFDTSSLLRR